MQLNIVILQQEIKKFQLAFEMRKMKRVYLLKWVDCVRHEVVNVCFRVCIDMTQRKSWAFEIKEWNDDLMKSLLIIDLVWFAVEDNDFYKIFLQLALELAIFDSWTFDIIHDLFYVRHTKVRIPQFKVNNVLFVHFDQSFNSFDYLLVKLTYGTIENIRTYHCIELSKNYGLIQMEEVFLRFKESMLLFDRFDFLEFMDDDWSRLNILNLFIRIIEVIL